MSTTALAWVAVAGALLVLSFARSAWAVALYLLTFFAFPPYWWWGDQLPDLRYPLFAGVVLAIATGLHVSRLEGDSGRRFTIVHAASLGMILNATLVQLALSTNPNPNDYFELVKFVLLFFLMWGAIQDKRDFRLALTAIALGAAYIGFEITVNARGDFIAGRLENVGAPGADASNSLADVMLVALPLIGGLFVNGSKLEKLLAVGAMLLALNVLLLCNSRGAFLGLIGAGLAFIFVARGPTRKKAIRTLMLGSVALYMLLGDPQIMDRFATTFVGSEQRDHSAASRFQFWEAGLRMLSDYPFGAGGGAFKYVLGARYLRAVTGEDEDNRSLHNGYLTEATDWGLQGLFLKLLFVGAAILAAYRTNARCRLEGRIEDALTGVCVLVAALGFLIHCLFGSFLANEWAYWIVALLVRYHELYQVGDSVIAAPADAVVRAPEAAA